jgi:hypothetical protein
MQESLTVIPGLFNHTISTGEVKHRNTDIRKNVEGSSHDLLSALPQHLSGKS